MLESIAFIGSSLCLEPSVSQSMKDQNHRRWFKSSIIGFELKVQHRRREGLAWEKANYGFLVLNGIPLYKSLPLCQCIIPGKTKTAVRKHLTWILSSPMPSSLASSSRIWNPGNLSCSNDSSKRSSCSVVKAVLRRLLRRAFPKNQKE